MSMKKWICKAGVLCFMAVIFMVTGQFWAYSENAAETKKTFMVSAYCNAYGYINWSRPNQTVVDIDVTKMTHLNFANARIDESSGTAYLENEIQIALRKVLEMRSQKNPDLKILLTVAGPGFSKTCATEQGRETFAASLAQLMNDNHLDGIDIDWEYPTLAWQDTACSPQDRQNFTALVQKLREKIGNDKLITVAGGAGTWYPACIEFDKLNGLVNYWNVMAYAFQQGQYLDANLYPSKLGDPSGLCGDSAITMYLNHGIPAEKLLLGIPYYALSNSGNYPADRWAYKYGEVQEMIASGGYTRVWDEEGQVPYLTKDGKFEITYDDEQSVQIKAQYVKTKGLAGAVVYETYYDNAQKSLGNTLWEELQVGEAPLSVELTASSQAPLMGENLEIVCNAAGGSGEYSYLFVILKDGRVMFRQNAFSSADKVSYTPQEKGRYQMKGYCVDKTSNQKAEIEKILEVI